MPNTATLTLHPINHNFPNDTNGPMETWVFSPDHLPSLLRGEYKFIRIHGGSREVARWHCHRMIDMMRSNWIAERIDDDLESFRYESFGVIQDGEATITELYEDDGEDEDGTINIRYKEGN